MTKRLDREVRRYSRAALPAALFFFGAPGMGATFVR